MRGGVAGGPASARAGLRIHPTRQQVTQRVEPREIPCAGDNICAQCIIRRPRHSAPCHRGSPDERVPRHRAAEGLPELSQGLACAICAAAHRPWASTALTAPALLPLMPANVVRRAFEQRVEARLRRAAPRAARTCNARRSVCSAAQARRARRGRAWTNGSTRRRPATMRPAAFSIHARACNREGLAVSGQRIANKCCHGPPLRRSLGVKGPDSVRTSSRGTALPSVPAATVSTSAIHALTPLSARPLASTWTPK